MKKKNREINIFSMSALDLFASAMGAFLLIAVIALPYYFKVDPELVKQVQQLKAEIVKNEAEIQSVQAELKQCQQAKAQALKSCEEEKNKLKKRNQELQKRNEQLKKELAKAQEQAQQVQEQLEQSKQESQELQKRNEELEAQASNMQKALSKTFCVIQMGWRSSQPQDIDLYVTDPRGNTYYYGKRYYQNRDTSITVDAGHPIQVKNGAEVWVSKELVPGTYTITYKYPSGVGPTEVFGSVLTKSFTKDLPIKRINKGDERKVATITVDTQGNATLQTY